MTDYRSTLNLPKTDFPMKAEGPSREPERLKQWEQLQLYQRLQGRPAERAYILHDGPPYANGDIHIGHVLNKTLKDIIVKFQTMRGARAPYVPGWDCHGMPIEHQLFKELGKTKHDVDRVEFRRKAQAFAQRYVEIQREQFKRLGIFGDWEHPYLTMDRAYEAAIIHTFRELFLKGYIYRGLKPVYWCWQCETALAEAEVEYRDKESLSLYVKFPIVGQPHASVVIWTTTPWTLPANRAVCVHPRHPYALVEVTHNAGKEQLLIASTLVASLATHVNGTVTKRLWEKAGRELVGRLTCQPPFNAAAVPVVGDDGVSLEEGTGIVHIAPGHGEEDYLIGKRDGLDVFSPVDAQGRFTDAVTAYRGQRVFEANAPILHDLEQRQLLLHRSPLQHSYPHCWRCQQPVIFRATPQWFVRVDHEGLRDRLLTAIGKVQWHPSTGQARSCGMIETRPDWCLSRQRLWGVPIPILYCERCHEPLKDPQFFDHLETLVGREGSDVWFARSVKELLPDGVRCVCGEARAFTKEEDILDVWLDSGVSHEAVLRSGQWPDLQWPADLYLEGSDQHRGWFQSSLIPSVALHDAAPYKAVLTHGFVVDGAGRKMSKSAGNVIAPEEILQRYGADVLRWWVASCDYTEDVRLSQEIVERTAESYRKMRNTCRFLLGNLADFDPRQHRVPVAQLTAVDRWMWARCQQFLAEVTAAYEAFEFFRVVRAVNAWCVTDLSAIYLDALKDALYTEAPHAPRRRSAQTVVYDILGVLVRVIAPVLPFLADEVWEAVPVRDEAAVSAQLLRWPVPQAIPEAGAVLAQGAAWLALRSEVLKALEEARMQGLIGSPLEAQVTLAAPPPEMERLTNAREGLTILTIVSALEVRPGAAGAQARAIQVRRAEGTKCARCWMFRTSVGQDAEHPTLCDRCVGVVRTIARTA